MLLSHVTVLSVCCWVDTQVTGRTALELGTLHDNLATMPVSAQVGMHSRPSGRMQFRTVSTAIVAPRTARALGLRLHYTAF
jgi:hypothetical protein